MSYLYTKHHKYQQPLLLWGGERAVWHGSSGKLLALGRAQQPSQHAIGSVLKPRTISCAQGRATHHSVCASEPVAARGLEVEQTLSGDGKSCGNTHIPLQLCRGSRDGTVPPIQQRNPSHKPWHRLLALFRAVPFPQRRSSNSFIPVDESH